MPLLRVGPLGLGPLELVIILLVLVMIFGASRLADIGGSLGKGIREFRREVGSDEEAEIDADEDEDTINAVKCGNCGSLNEVSARHCNQCGNALAASVNE